MSDLKKSIDRKVEELSRKIGETGCWQARKVMELRQYISTSDVDDIIKFVPAMIEDKKNLNCPFCGYEKQIGADCPKCGRGGVILKVEDVAAGCRYHKPLSEHDSFDSAYEAACKLFDDGTWDDFLIDDGGHLTSLPGYRLVKETCPKCGKEARPFEMYGTRDYYGIPFRRVCAKCYERIMTTTGYDGVKYDERDENLDADY